jgi:hypothetical protein
MSGAHGFVALLVAALVVASSSSAQAHPEYPPAIDAALGLKKTVETLLPPNGCQLCHTDPGGGTQLNRFGSLLVSSYGLSNDPVAPHVSSLQQALMELQAGDPHAIEDLKSGINPNNDPVVFENALPTPDYGCSLTGAPVEQERFQGSAVAAAAAVAMLLGAARSCSGRRRRRRST